MAILQVALHAQANVSTSARWAMDPCRREDILFKQDRGQRANPVQDCFTLNHQLGLMTNPGGPWADVFNRMTNDGVKLPLPLVLHAACMRIYHRDFLAVDYHINPVYYGYAADRGQNWLSSPWHKSRIDSDPEKAMLVKAIVEWGLRMQPLLYQGLEGKDPLAKGATVPSMDFPRGTRKVPAKE